MKLLGGRLPTVEEARELMYSLLGSPVWQVVMDVRLSPPSHLYVLTEAAI